VKEEIEMIIHPRFLARLLAFFGGYFWLPCPICHKPFAGFEWGEASIMLTPSSGQGVCSKPSCVAEAKRLNKKFYADNDTQIFTAN
jgi:hypothetical protein